MAEKRLRVTLVAAGVAWDSLWKAWAIRRAVRNRQYRWIMPLLFINSAGLLPIAYLLRWAAPKSKRT